MSEDLKSPDTAQPKTSFGFARVREDAKQGLVNEVFARVARSYDLMNDLMSGGLHRLWKNDLVSWLAPPKSAVPYPCSMSPAEPATWPCGCSRPQAPAPRP